MASNERRWLSTKAVNDLLIEVIEEPAKWLKNNELIKALKSQGKLAKFENKERSIYPCSLNTLKSSADDVLGDGFVGLNLRRTNALKILERESFKKQRPKRGSRVALEELVREQALHVTTLEARNMILTYLIKELQSLAIEAIYSDCSEATIKRQERNLEIIQSKLADAEKYDLQH